MNAIIRRVNNSIRVRNIDSRVYNSSKYIKLDFYISKKLLDNFSIIVYFRKKIYIVENFRVNVLLNVDILKSKKNIIDFERRLLIFLIYDDLQLSLDIVLKN